ncbi:XisI protein [Kamptonema animale CS-326]|jgi:hypothetical protein|uniref:XisI protein n=1 Tax=Kamptonema animale TaxID=92934 RepID=UPI00232EF919|nr:XisI protein [Kamptonema animale]MDB9514984.1 XisI protein [Kamptonema animale CS-326]
MGKVEQYRQYVQEVLARFGDHKPAYGDVKVEMIFDTQRDHYQIVHVGWNKKQRVYGVVIHLDIEEEKVWIQWNGTEVDLASELMAMGVAKQDIVLGFHSSFMRKFTEFAPG